MAKKPLLSVIIPAYNEENRIGATLTSIHDYLSRVPFHYEIIVVNDGSQDKTTKIVKSAQAEISNLLLVDRKENKGKGLSVKEGMLKAQGTIRLFTDADNATDISHFDAMHPFFKKGYDVVIASRHKKDAPTAHQAIVRPWHKKLLGTLGNFYIQKIILEGIWDTQCGFKAFHEHTAQKIFAISHVKGWMFDVEILALARKYGCKIGIVPAHWVNHPETRVKLSTYIQALFEVWNIRRRIHKIKI